MYTLTFISCNTRNYIPNQAISVAKLCFYCVFILCEETELRGPPIVSEVTDLRGAPIQ